jgi:CheY-like chemotaxis protein
MKSKVLLIDDSVTIHRVIDLSIDVDRYDIVKVFSKEDAALKMQSEQYDYILLDNKLDNIIISEYIKELKAAQPSASIILLVGAFDRFDESDLEKTGADDYLVKPFDSQSLNEKLSSDADMMPAGIVEKIAEADFARDNDDYITPTASLTTGEVIDGLSKKEYLENLEEVQPDDLTDNGYAEDLDAAPSLEFDKLPKEAEEALQERQEENIQSEEQTEVDNPAESTIIEESPEEDIIVEENKEEEPVSVTLDDAAVETLSFEEPAVSEEAAEPAVEQEQETENIEEVNTADDEEVLDIPAAEENTQAEELPEQIVEEPALEDVPAVEETAEDIPLTADAQEEENTPVNTEEIEIPDNVEYLNPKSFNLSSITDVSVV